MPRRRKPAPPRSSNVQPFSLREFFERFPTEEACLEHLMKIRFGLRHECAKCHQVSTFHRLADRPAYTCARCGANVHPCAGTIFQDTRTPLRMWFFAIYLFVTTRHGVSGKELQRQLGVTYKTAYRMGQQIRVLMEKADIKGLLVGHIEMDEAYVGGHRRGKRGRGAEGKTISSCGWGYPEYPRRDAACGCVAPLGARSSASSRGSTESGLTAPLTIGLRRISPARRKLSSAASTRLLCNR
jgi:hypothetical protein